MLCGPGEPFDLNAVHPDEARATVGGPAGDVPVLFDSRVGERSVVGIDIHGEDPTCIALYARCAPGLVEGRCCARGGIP